MKILKIKKALRFGKKDNVEKRDKKDINLNTDQESN